KHFVFINSTYQGGGVAEMLNSMVPLLNKEGLKLGWRILHGYADFFNITKSIHNALQGDAVHLSSRKKELYEAVNKRFSLFTHLDHDLVVVHDPQPLPLIKYYAKKQPWLLRLHIDLSTPFQEVWKYLVPMINKYDGLVISAKEYYNSDLKLPYHIVMPAIDPLSIKNKSLRSKKISKYLERYGIPQDKPIISQISRFDKWKDPVGVIKIFESVRRKKEATLVLLGSFASDDPEGQQVYNQVIKVANKSKYAEDIKVLAVNSDILVNAVQRSSEVVIQKSLREGFGLVVSEAMYKKKPVVGSNVRGIALQIQEGYNGYLCSPQNYGCFSKKIQMLLENEELRSTLGNNAYNTVIDKFLITRLIDEWLDLFIRYLSL
ncbi:MAG: glycosyltransferase, partial [Candidatus Nanohaloarchaeota archaeon]|nr:glycosyltransferase [Candidatus Nanohaloarchaeota archaeon]